LRVLSILDLLEFDQISTYKLYVCKVTLAPLYKNFDPHQGIFT
jgi:hypothetical protein